MRKLLFSLFLLLTALRLGAQELNVTVRINTQKLQSTDPKVFATLEATVREFLNTQKWTEEVFELEERINANVLITIQEEISATSFKADIAIQASRPVYGSDYETPLINHIDKGVTFFYEQFQPLQFSQNAFNDNLSSVLAFYAYIMLGLDFDSFSPYGGEPYFQAAQDILNNVTQAAAAANPGWRSLDGNRNRFWLIENILSPRVRPYRQAWYDYHRQGLDLCASDVATGRAIIAAALEEIRNVDQAYPNSMIIQVFTDTKSQEILEIFKRGTPQEQNTVVQVMTRIDASNAAQYRAIK
ncbi:MAG: DUF4835 family protein [Lewinellaceae bacterium]|nr:DUF4835 family protein [Phaeodactylibacter sp.]MCB0614896.1 DUF4835 family protein [Phaeodactylibacter sp.]MCB9348563.1 DUF4835 family protein [Lewinellaceae bacterium]